MPTEIEQNAILAASVEFRYDPHSVAAGIDRFDRFLAADHLQLRLKDVTSGKSFQIDAYGDPGAGMAFPDRGRDCVLLSQSPVQQVAAEFPLRAGEPLKPGRYECTFNYSTRRYPGFAESGPPPGNWTGELETKPISLTVRPEIRRPYSLLIPKQLRLTSDQQVIFRHEDAERITAALGNGMYMGTRVTWSGRELLLGGLLEPDGANPIDDWKLADAAPLGGKREYVIEIFATSDRPYHMWGPGPGANDYQTLWQGHFLVQQNVHQ